MLLTVGHGTLDRDGLARLLTGAGVELPVDSRRFPGRRADPAGAEGSGRAPAAAAGSDARWEGRLGGRRRPTAADRRDSPDTWWRVEAFRAYCAWTRDAGFRSALEGVVADARERRTAVMCSE